MPTPPGLAPEAEGAAEPVEDADAEAREGVRRGRLITAVVAGALVVVVGVVALLGGFRARTDLQTPVAVGSVIATGPYEVTIESATYQHATSDDEWKVVATGTARTTGTTSIDPPTGDSGFVAARSETTRESQTSDSIQLGDPDASERVDSLTPGLPPVRWSLTFVFARDPGDRVVVGVFDQEYTTPYLFSDEQGWRATRDVSTMTLPMTRLPDREY